MKTALLLLTVLFFSGSAALAAELYKADFSQGVPAGWKAVARQDNLPPGYRHSLAPLKDDKGKLVLISHNAWVDGHFAFDPQAKLRITYRTKEKSNWFQILLQVKEPGAQAKARNVMGKFANRPAGKWQTVELRLSDFEPIGADTSTPGPGLVVSAINFDFAGRDLGFELLELSVVR